VRALDDRFIATTPIGEIAFAAPAGISRDRPVLLLLRPESACHACGRRRRRSRRDDRLCALFRLQSSIIVWNWRTVRRCTCRRCRISVFATGDRVQLEVAGLAAWCVGPQRERRARASKAPWAHCAGGPLDRPLSRAAYLNIVLMSFHVMSPIALRPRLHAPDNYGRFFSDTFYWSELRQTRSPSLSSARSLPSSCHIRLRGNWRRSQTRMRGIYYGIVLSPLSSASSSAPMDGRFILGNNG